MSSRMNKYYEEPENLMTRTTRNQDLYKDIKDVRIISSVCVLLNYLTSTQKRSIDTHCKM